MREHIIQTKTQASMNLKIQFQKQFLKMWRSLHA